MNAARIHDKQKLMSFWEQKIVQHGEQVDGEEDRRRSSALPRSAAKSLAGGHAPFQTRHFKCSLQALSSSVIKITDTFSVKIHIIYEYSQIIIILGHHLGFRDQQPKLNFSSFLFAQYGKSQIPQHKQIMKV